MTDYLVYAKQCGLTEAAFFDPRTVSVEDAAILRQGCEANSCGKYGKNWSCPPGIGAVEEVAAKVKHWHHGMVMQFLTDAIDTTLQPEVFKEVTAAFHLMIRKVYNKVLAEQGDAYLLGRGACAVCKDCTYPEHPCRYPEKMVPCISSHGINVYRLWDGTGYPRSTPSETDLYAMILY